DGDQCHSGACVGGAEVVCQDDGNPCTTEYCDPAAGCVSEGNDDACDDGNACTVGDMCGEGGCVPGTEELSCDDGDPCTTDSCDPATGCKHEAIPYCGLCPVCEGVSSLTLKVTGGSSRDQNETIRVRKNSSSGTIIWSGKVATGASFTPTLPAGTTKIYITVQGANHYNETLKATFDTSCDLAAGATGGNSYIQFKVTGVDQAQAGVSCDDGDECTADACGASGCTHTEIPGCRMCEVCTGTSALTLKVTGGSSRDQNETIRVRKNSSTGTILWSGKVATYASFTPQLTDGTTKIYVTVQGANHPSETLKATFTTDCTCVEGQTGGNSYIQFKVTSVTHATALEACTP
ncbi:MAG: hypothetical protein KC635_16525, partial [Myxococcales bacterium]|nr:hypothetical protein [Myxococcales bacterium]